MDEFFYELDRLFFVCNKRSSVSYNLKGFVFDFRYKYLNDKWFPDTKILKHIFKRYGFKYLILYLCYLWKVKSYLRFYKNKTNNIQVINDNSSLWKFYGKYEKINERDKTIIDKDSITIDNHLFVER